ncbi:Putative germin-like protein subfamily 1 member 9 [Striga hermonthica]|uniref:Germin-like protein n=1 Tax=Striga hermonthica TaxID=68872 RepID=A0A9N7RKV4_STRHE|nr:Putative germin-like protein subfamily 1 member 9 [Striga hermonthica]
MTIPEGGVFYVPMGLLHYQRNALNDGNTVAFSVFNRQSPGLNSFAHAALKSSPLIQSGYLASALQLDEKTIHMLQGKNWRFRCCLSGPSIKGKLSLLDDGFERLLLVATRTGRQGRRFSSRTRLCSD